MTHKLGRALICLALAAGLHACAVAPVGQDDMSFPQRREHLSGYDGWDVRGRIAVNTGTGAFQGRFHWRETGESLELAIRGPLGTGILEVAGPQNELTVRARGETFELDDPEAELSALLGWWLPVRSLSTWLLGLPDPAFPSVTSLGPDNALLSLEQRLWQITYQSYRLADGVLLPRRIDMAHRDLELRIVVDRWQSITGQ